MLHLDNMYMVYTPDETADICCVYEMFYVLLSKSSYYNTKTNR